MVRIRSQRWHVVQITAHASASVLEVAGGEAGNRGTRATFLLPAERVDVVDTSVRPRMVSASRWQRLARGTLGHGLSRFDTLRSAASARISIIPFQLEPAMAVARGVGSRLLIADEVGLGKTVQAGLVAAEILSRHAGARVLIVTPAALREQWAMELEARLDLRVAVIDGRSLASMTAAGRMSPWSTRPVVVTSIDFVKRPEVLRGLDALLWDLAVFDEAHVLCGTSERAAAADGIARRSRCVVLLSATPHSGDASTFARLCRIGALAHDPLLVFRRTRDEAGQSAGRRTIRLRVRPTAAETKMHHALLRYARRVWRESSPGAAPRLAITVLLKRACSSATALARSLERRLRLLSPDATSYELQMGLPFDVSDADAEPVSVLGAGGLLDRDDECRRLEVLIALAQNAARVESKIAALRRLLRRVRQPALIFTEYRDTLAHLVADLPDTSSVQIHGGLSASERRDAIHAFTHGEAGVLLATDAASEGLNLQRRCRLVVTLELPWTPVRLEQRIGRVDRIGQRERVHAVHLVAAGTPEEEVASRLSARQARAQGWFASIGRVREEEVASAIVLETAMPDTSAPGGGAHSDHELLFPDLRLDALEEARRLAGCRALLAAPGDEVVDRPIVALLPARGAAQRRTCVCAQIPFVDRADRVHWRAIVAAEVREGVRGDVAAPQRRAAPTELLWARLGRDSPPLVTARSSVGAWVRQSMARELALAADLRKRRGRLAGCQPGLFDRRAERRTSVQSAELDLALHTSDERVRALEALLEAAPGPPDPVFTLAIR